MVISPTENHPRRRQELSRSLMIRLINETIERIRKDSSFIVLPSREETVAATLTSHMELAGIPPKNDGIPLENDAPDATLDEEDNPHGPDPDLPPLNDAEIKSALDAISGLSVVEKVIFADDLHWLVRKEQEEFLNLLNHRV